jgi:hypothetical protein
MFWSKTEDTGIWKRKHQTALCTELFGTGCGPTVNLSKLWTNWAHIDSHTETCRGIVHDVILNMLISKIYLLIHQDSHRRTHVHDVTPAINYSPERKKNESSQNVTRWKKRSLYIPRRQGSSHQTKPYTHPTSSRTSFPVCTAVQTDSLLLISTYIWLTKSEFLKVNSALASGEIPHILRIHHRVRNSTPPVPIISQMYPVHMLPSHFIKIHFNIILLSKHTSSRCSSLRFPYQ